MAGPPPASRTLPPRSIPIVGTGYTYLQDYLVHVAQAVVREGWTDFVGLGRMVLAYPELPADSLAGKALARKRICRTFSDCTTAPRSGLVMMLAGATSAENDRKSKVELYGLLGLLIGAAVGCGLAVMRQGRRDRRSGPTRAAA